MAAEPVQLAVFAKAPVAGLAKTRLAPALGAAGAARLQRAMLLRTLATARAAAIGPLTLWCAPDRGQRLFRALRGRCGVDCRDQSRGDVGARMAATFRRLLPEGAVVLIGSDCPALRPDHLRTAAAALGEVDAVFHPAEDGGYVLIGLRRFDERLFRRIPWGSERVWDATRKRLAALGWSWRAGAVLPDIDEPGDLARLPPELVRWSISARDRSGSAARSPTRPAPPAGSGRE